MITQGPGVWRECVGQPLSRGLWLSGCTPSFPQGSPASFRCFVSQIVLRGPERQEPGDPAAPLAPSAPATPAAVRPVSPSPCAGLRLLAGRPVPSFPATPFSWALLFYLANLGALPNTLLTLWGVLCDQCLHLTNGTPIPQPLPQGWGSNKTGVLQAP